MLDYKQMKIVVTGATGYIGQRFTKKVKSRPENEVIAAGRIDTGVGRSFLFFDFFSDITAKLPPDIKWVVHLATNTSSIATQNEKIEILAAKSLLEEAKRVGARFLFLSSQTAREDAPTQYGKTKWAIEQEVMASDGVVVRPGQVYGGRPAGLFGEMVDLVERLPVLPAFLPEPKLQPIHLDDLVAGMLSIVEQNDIPSNIYCLGSATPISFTSFLNSIASVRLRKHRLFVPIPAGMALFGARVWGAKATGKIRIDQLKSLFNLPQMDTSKDLAKLGIKLRSLSSGMHRSGNAQRRLIGLEANTLFYYLLLEKPKSSVIRRYIRAIETLQQGQALSLPRLTILSPITLALLDDPAFTSSTKGRQFAWRLDSATLLAEATPQGANRFLPPAKGAGAINSFVNIATTVIQEVCWRLLRLGFAPFVWRTDLYRKGGE